MPTKFPKLFTIRIQSGVISGVTITASIAQPDIVIFVGKKVGWKKGQKRKQNLVWKENKKREKKQHIFIKNDDLDNCKSYQDLSKKHLLLQILTNTFMQNLFLKYWYMLSVNFF